MLIGMYVYLKIDQFLGRNLAIRLLQKAAMIFFLNLFLPYASVRGVHQMINL